MGNGKNNFFNIYEILQTLERFARSFLKSDVFGRFQCLTEVRADLKKNGLKFVVSNFIIF